MPRLGRLLQISRNSWNLQKAKPEIILILNEQLPTVYQYNQTSEERDRLCHLLFYHQAIWSPLYVPNTLRR